jgi:predicted aconitase with swiveling domain
VTAEPVVLDEPLSLWGGLDPTTGTIVDAHHPQRGATISGRVLVMPAGRGSSSSASVLAEAARLGTAPVAIFLREPDLILAIGAAVAEELYGVRIAVTVTATDDDAAGIRDVSPGASRDNDRVTVPERTARTGPPPVE